MGHFVFLFQLPVLDRNYIEKFFLYKTLTFPITAVNVSGKVFELSNLNNYHALNSRYLLGFDSIDRQCKITVMGYFCTIDSPLYSRDKSNCMNSVLSLSPQYLKYCDILIKNSENSDKIIRFRGVYYYSIHERKTLSLSCENTNRNKQLVLQGIGKFILKSGCIAQNDEIMLTSTRLKVTKFHVGGLMNQPQGNNLVKLRSSFKHLNITTGFLEYIKSLNHSNIKFKNAIKRYAIFKNMETIQRGIFDDITGDVMIVTLSIVLAVIVIAFIYYLRKYGMNGACWQRNAKLQKPLNECVTQGSGGPQNVPRDVGVKPIKVIKCGSCGVTPLCCRDCSEQTVLQSTVVDE